MRIVDLQRGPIAARANGLHLRLQRRQIARHTEDRALGPQEVGVALTHRTDERTFEGRRYERWTLRQEAAQIERPTGLRAGARQAVTAERLHADNRADQIAVH